MVDKISLPDDIEQRITEMEKRADEALPGDYTIEVNLFTDDEGRDAHVKAVHNTDSAEYIIHENCEGVYTVEVHRTASKQQSIENTEAVTYGEDGKPRFRTEELTNSMKP